MSLDLTDWQNKKYTTRDGRPVRILCVDAVGEYPIIGTLIDKGYVTREYPYVWYLDGMRGSYENGDDLINAKTKKEGWVNVYKDQQNKYLLGQSREIADLYANDARIACVKIEWEE